MVDDNTNNGIWMAWGKLGMDDAAGRCDFGCVSLFEDNNREDGHIPPSQKSSGLVMIFGGSDMKGNGSKRVWIWDCWKKQFSKDIGNYTIPDLPVEVSSCRACLITQNHPNNDTDNNNNGETTTVIYVMGSVGFYKLVLPHSVWKSIDPTTNHNNDQPSRTKKNKKKWNTSLKWHTIHEHMVHGHGFGFVSTSNNILYRIGGSHTPTGGVSIPQEKDLSSVELFSTRTNACSFGPKLPVSLSHSSATLAPSNTTNATRIIVTGGKRNSIPQRQSYILAQQRQEENKNTKNTPWMTWPQDMIQSFAQHHTITLLPPNPTTTTTTTTTTAQPQEPCQIFILGGINDGTNNNNGKYKYNPIIHTTRLPTSTTATTTNSTTAVLQSSRVNHSSNDLVLKEEPIIIKQSYVVVQEDLRIDDDQESLLLLSEEMKEDLRIDDDKESSLLLSEEMNTLPEAEAVAVVASLSDSMNDNTTNMSSSVESIHYEEKDKLTFWHRLTSCCKTNRY